MKLEGTLGDNDISTIIQFPTFSQWTGVLNINSGDKRGFIGYLKGKAIHAQAKDIKGPEAVFLMMHWNEGDFRFTSEDVGHVETTIQVDLQQLILEGLRRLDEENEARNVSGADEQDEGDQFAAMCKEILTSGYQGMNAPPNAVAIVSPPGDTIAFIGDASFREKVNAFASSSLDYIRELQEGENLDGFSELLLADHAGCFVMQAFKPGWVVVAAAGSTANLGKLKFQIQKLAGRLESVEEGG